MHNLGGTEEAVMLHGPFISLQNSPASITIPQTSAEDSHLANGSTGSVVVLLVQMT